MASLWESLCPWGDQEVFGGATFEVSLDPISATDLFDTFTKTLCVGYDYVTLTLNFSGGSRGTVSTLVVSPINGLTGRPVEPFLHLVQSPLGIFALSESLPEVFFFLFEQLIYINLYKLESFESPLATLIFFSANGSSSGYVSYTQISTERRECTKFNCELSKNVQLVSNWKPKDIMDPFKICICDQILL